MPVSLKLRIFACLSLAHVHHFCRKKSVVVVATVLLLSCSSIRSIDSLILLTNNAKDEKEAEKRQKGAAGSQKGEIPQSLRKRQIF